MSLINQMHEHMKAMAKAMKATNEVLDEIQSSSIADLIGSRTPPRPAKSTERKVGRRQHRATPGEVEAQKHVALEAVRKLGGKGVSRGDVMKKSGSKTDLGRALHLLVDAKVLTMKGDRRGARYFLATNAKTRSKPKPKPRAKAKKADKATKVG
jgi:hypothetical protein